MKLDPRKTGIDNLLALLRKDNPDADIKAEQIEVGELVDNASMRTVTTITAKKGKGYDGAKEIDYLRRRLDEHLKEGQYIYIEDGGETEESFKQAVGDAVGIVWSELDWSEISIPRPDSNQIVFITVSTESNLVYRDREIKDIVVTTTDLTNPRGINEDDYRVTSNGMVRLLNLKHQDVGIFWGGYTNFKDSIKNDKIKLIDPVGTVLSNDTFSGVARAYGDGTKLGRDGFYLAGEHTDNAIYKINSFGVWLFNNVNSGLAKTSPVMFSINNKAYAYAGSNTNSSSNSICIYNGTGAALGINTDVGASLSGRSAGAIEEVGLAVGGQGVSDNFYMTRISELGTLLSESATLGMWSNSASSSLGDKVVTFGGSEFVPSEQPALRYTDFYKTFNKEGLVTQSETYLSAGTINVTSGSTETVGIYMGGRTLTDPSSITSAVTRITSDAIFLGNYDYLSAGIVHALGA